MRIAVGDVDTFVTDAIGDRNRGEAHLYQQRYMAVPLRYNNDKREKSSIQGDFYVCRCLFNSFSKVDNWRVNCREKEAVKVMTKRGHFIL